MGDQMRSYHPIVFVTGTGRSGTNITKKLFAQHPDIATLPFEHRFTIDPLGVVDFYRSYPQQWSPYWCDYKVKDFIRFLRSLGSVSPEKASKTEAAKANDPTGLVKTHPSYAGWALEEWFPGYSALVDELEKSLVAFDYSGRWPGSQEGVVNNRMQFTPRLTKSDLQGILTPFLDDLTAAVLSQQNRSIFLEDNTHSLLYASSLFELYPNAKMIHVVRDPRDVLASLMEQPWCPNDLDQLLHWYKEIWKTWESERSTLAQDVLLEVRLEDLIGDTKNTIERMSAFIGVDAEDKLFDIPLNKGHMNRYKSTFNSEQIEKIEHVGCKVMIKFGYRNA